MVLGLSSPPLGSLELRSGNTALNDDAASAGMCLTANTVGNKNVRDRGGAQATRVMQRTCVLLQEEETAARRSKNPNVMLSRKQHWFVEPVGE